MKVKEFDSYRAPRRKPWGAVVLVLLIGLMTYWFVIREKREPKPRVKSENVQTPGVAPVARGRSAMRVALPEKTDVPPVPLDLAEGIDLAARLVAADQLVEARQAYLQLLARAESPALLRQIEQRLGDVNIKLVLSPRPMPEKIEYLVKRGDSLGVIANRFGTTTLLIQKNNLLANPNLIKVGDRLHVFTGKFELVANKSTHEMTVLMNGEFFKRYKVGTGVYGRTPVGTFVVRDKIPEPTWWPPDGREVPFGHKDNILGTRWMSVRATGDTPDVRGYGIHGTWEPESVGMASSAGCLRMINEQVEELFIYIPVGTPLRITE